MVVAFKLNPLSWRGAGGSILGVRVAGIIAIVIDPFAFASGYGSTGLDAAYKQHPVVRKPFQAEDLERAIERVA